MTPAVAAAQRAGIEFRLHEYEDASYGESDYAVAGGISPLGQRKRLPLTLDDSALAFDTILVSAVKRGLQIELALRDLVRLTGGETRAVSRA